MPFRPSAVVSLVVLPGVFALVGCSDGNKAFVLNGSVSYQGKPLKSGLVRLHMADGRAGMAMIHPDGTFEATDVIPGDAKVTIEEDPATRNRRMMGGGGAAAPSLPDPANSASAPVAIPSKYQDVKTTPLSYTLKRGTPLKIELE